MFGHTQFSIGPQFPSHNIDGRKLSPATPRPKSPSISKQVARGTDQIKIPKTKETKESPLSERYSNKSYNRVPSPVSRLQPRPSRPASGSSSVREASKPRGLSSTGFRNVVPSDKSPRLASGIKNDKERVGPRLYSPASSASDMARLRPLQEQCTLRSTLQPRLRPRTAGNERDELDDRLMLAVKEALSTAVLERGPIYEHNIDTIMYDMRNRLRRSDDNRGEAFNENTSSETIGNGKVKPLAGIVRKDLGDSVKATQSSYKRVYGDGLKRSPSNRVIDNDPDTIVFIDLPDPDSSNFNLVLNKGRNQSNTRQTACGSIDVGNKYSRSVTTPGNMNLERESEEDMSQYVEERVGDGQPRISPSFTIWKDTDDTKLERYISKLINNMNNQLRGDSPNEGIGRDAETESAVCKAFCVCKVCLNKKESKKVLKEPVRQSPRSLDNSSFRPTSSVRSNIGKSNPILKASTNLKVLKKAENLVLDSKSTINPQGTLFSCPQTAHAPDPVIEMDEEAREEMYIKRRMRMLAPLKRN